MSKELIAELGPVVDGLAKKGPPLETSALAKLAEQIGKAFRVRTDEVAILAFTQQGRFLRFLIPEKLQQIGTIPMTSTSALAVRTARDKRPEVINNFPAARHQSVFEAVPLGDEPSNPIQKIMTAPISAENTVLGVIQISRKGKSFESAGPDFTARELSELVAVGKLLGPCLKLYPDT